MLLSHDANTFQEVYGELMCCPILGARNMFPAIIKDILVVEESYGNCCSSCRSLKVADGKVSCRQLLGGFKFCTMSPLLLLLQS